MIEMIYKERKGAEWERFFVKTKGDIHSTDFCNPIQEKEVELVTFTKKLFLLDYLFFNVPKGVTKLNFQMVLDAIPKEILKEVTAVELFYIFDIGDPWLMSLFNEDKRQTSIFWVALLTEKDTGKDLPPVRPTAKDISDDTPIGVSTEEWDEIRREFYLK